MVGFRVQGGVFSCKTAGLANQDHAGRECEVSGYKQLLGGTRAACSCALCSCVFDAFRVNQHHQLCQKKRHLLRREALRVTRW